MRRNQRAIWTVVSAAVVVLAAGGCTGPFDLTTIKDIIQTAEEAVNRVIDNIQEHDPRWLQLPGDAEERGLRVQLREGTRWVYDVSEDLTADEIDDIILLAFENLTGYDIFVEYEVDGDPQTVYVVDGDTLLLAYDCFETIELVYETDFDPDTGEFVAVHIFEDVIYGAPDDFTCGDLFVISIDDQGVLGTTETVDLATGLLVD